MPLSEESVKTLRCQVSNVRVPSEHSQVEKDECMLSFDSQFSPNGLYTNLKTWQSYGRDYVSQDCNSTGQRVYLYQRFYKHKRLKKAQDAEEEPSKLGIGVEGGFTGFDQGFDVEKTYFLALLPQFELIDLTESDIPLLVSECCNAIIAHSGIPTHDKFAAWEDEEAKESQHAKDLVQLEATRERRASPNPNDWKCAECSKQDNLWFNLSDGYIGCGRQQFDGSGGCGAALRHFDETGRKYPLSVKLGTITPQGADVFSYAEDDMVKDPQLNEHLQHWSIDVMKLEKTEKSMEELNLDLNKKYIFSLITEDGKSLTKVTGAGFVGLDNLGNSCYMNSLLQTIFYLPEMKAKYFDDAEAMLFSAPSESQSDDFVTQACKLAVGLLSDRYVKQQNEVDKFEEERYNRLLVESGANKEANGVSDQKEELGVKNVGLKPRMWKRLLGKGHAEFSSNRQQDVAEYFRHILEFMNRAERVSKRVNSNVAGLKHLFKFQMEERLQCAVSKKVRYTSAEDVVLRADVDLEDAVNKKEVTEYQERERKRQRLNEASIGAVSTDEKPSQSVEDAVRPIIPFKKCLEHWCRQSVVNDWLSPATNQKGQALKSQGILSFPKYLAVQVSRYYTNDKWLPEKHDVDIPVPEEMDMAFLRASGLTADEEELPKGCASNANAVAAPQPDEIIVAALLSMGFGDNACKRAALGVNNANADMAAAWLMEHMTDPDLNDPLPDPNVAAAVESLSGDEVDMTKVEMLSASLGFEKDHVMVALKHTNGDEQRAADWLFSHMDNLGDTIAAMEAEQNASAKEKRNYSDGKGEYSLFGIISHLGNATSHGHYVVHLKKNGEWYIFNDSKVAKSENPPFAHGYLYLFQRKDAN